MNKYGGVADLKGCDKRVYNLWYQMFRRCFADVTTRNNTISFQKFELALNVLERVMEKENDLAKIANYAFVDAFRTTAKVLSEVTSRTYVSYLDEAMDMLLEGNDPAEVLCYFDLILERMKEGV